FLHLSFFFHIITLKKILLGKNQKNIKTSATAIVSLLYAGKSFLFIFSNFREGFKKKRPKQRSNVRFTGILFQIILGGISMNKFVAHVDSIFEGDHFRKLDEKRKQRAARDIIEAI